MIEVAKSPLPESMIQHYNYIVDMKRKEIEELEANLAYKKAWLEQLESTLKEKLTLIVS